MTDSPEKIKRDWKEIVSKSNGTLVFCPEKLLEEAKDWEAKRKNLESELDRVAKIEIETKVALENVVFHIRQYLEEIGTKNIWTGEVGFQTEALKEGVYILSIDNK